MMPCYGIMADVLAQSQHICYGVQDCEHQWSCWLCQHYWFVVVVIWVVFLPLLNRNPQLRTTQVLSGAYHVHTHVSIYCAPGTQQQWCSFAATQQCLPACWGLCNSCGQHTKGSGVAGVAYVAPGKLWGPLVCPQWWLHALRSMHYCFRS